MLTERDRSLLKFLEDNKGISTQQAKYIFFDGIERSAIRRLNQLEDKGILEYYYRGKNKIYKLVGSPELSYHDTIIYDFYAWIYKQGGSVLDFKKNPHFINNMLIPDGLFKCRLPYKDTFGTFFFILEVDYQHPTSDEKIKVFYEKLYREQTLKEYCGVAEFPMLIIAKEYIGFRERSNNFEIIYTDFKFKNLYDILTDI